MKLVVHHSNWAAPLSGMGLGCAKTQACCGAVEWRSQASGVLSFSREARLLAPSDTEAKKSRKFRDSYTSGARLAYCFSCYYVPSRGVIWRNVGIGF